jgi:hypothetical protein
MSAFSGFSIARDQRGVWFREGTGTADEDRVSIYTFLVARELAEVAYYAIRERLAKKILRERNEKAVLLSRLLDPKCGLQMEFVSDDHKESDYRAFASAFERRAEHISGISPPRVDLAWKLLHLFQLLYRDLMASVFSRKHCNEEKKQMLQSLFRSLRRMVEGIFEGRILDRMSTFVLVGWVKIANELHDFGDEQAVPVVKPHVEQALRRSILEIADSLWRFRGHSLAGAGDLDRDSFGVEAFAFVSGLNTSVHTLRLGLEGLADAHGEQLRDLWTDPTYVPHLLLRDWRGLCYSLSARERKTLAAAFGLHTVDAIVRSGISDERTWYRTMREFFPEG